VQRKNYRDVRAARGPLTIEVEVPGPGYRHLVTADDLRRFIALIPGWAEVSVGLHAIVLAGGDPCIDGRYEDGVIELHAWRDPPATSVGARHFAEHRAVYERLGVRWRASPRFIAAVPVKGTSVEDMRAVVELIRDELEDDELILAAAEDGEVDAWVAIDRKLRHVGPVCCDVTRIGAELHVYERCHALAFDRRTAAAYQLLHVFLHELGHHIDACAPLRRGWRGEEYAEGWALRCADRIWAAYVTEFG